jgi:probable rRNA maturation factor
MLTKPTAVIARPHIRIRSAYRMTGRLSHVRAAALAAFAIVGQPARETEWTISLTGDEELHCLNLQFRGIDKPTDVLSFGGEGYRDGKLKPQSDAVPAEDGAPEYLGDIVISMERCTEQANGAAHPVETELALLVIHGTLHLLGYDHDTKARKARMWLAQARALQSIGITLDVP